MKLTYKKISAYDYGYLELLMYETIFTLNDEEIPDPSVIKERPYQQYITPWHKEDIGYIAIDFMTKEAVGAAWLKWFTPNRPGPAYINDDMPELMIIVDSKYRNQGVGTDLVHYLMAQLPTTVKGISLGVDIRNPIMEFFERLGFTSFKINKTTAIMRYDRH